MLLKKTDAAITSRFFSTHHAPHTQPPFRSLSESRQSTMGSMNVERSKSSTIWCSLESRQSVLMSSREMPLALHWR